MDWRTSSKPAWRHGVSCWPRWRRGDGPERTVVAAVRFAGVDQPTFREPETLALAISSDGADRRRAVDDGRSGHLCAREAILGGLDAMAESARQAADCVSSARSVARAPRAGRLRRDVSAAHQPDRRRRTESDAPSDLHGPDASGAEFLERLNASLGALIDFDVNEDWLSVADVLEYDIADLLPQWAAVVRDGDGRRIAGSVS